MNRSIVLAVALALAPAAWGQLYKYVDKDGKTVYTDQPPANIDSKPLRGPPAPAEAAKTAVEKAPEKARTEATRGAAKPSAPSAPRTAEEKEARCQAARADYVIFLDGPVTMRNTATGERFQLDEKGMEAEKAKAKAAMDEACRKP
jgi:hypothetical protein